MVSSTAKRRSRMFGYLLMFNWGLLGYLMFAVGSQNRIIFFLSFLFGLICFGMSMGQVRARRLAETAPLISITDEALEFRRFTSAAMETVKFSAIRSLDATNPKFLLLQLDQDETTLVGLGELTPDDRRQVIDEVDRRTRT
jgi:hypothetical protein